MFAGRYLWWMLMSIAGFLFFAVYFDYVTWLFIQLSACQTVAGACSGIYETMAGRIKPAGFLIAGAVVVTCTAARLFYVRMSPLWNLAFAIWFLASAPFVLIFRRLWSGHLQLPLIVASMPPAFLMLCATIAFLIFPLEYAVLRDDGWRHQLHRLAAVAAIYGALWTLATQAGLAAILGDWSGLHGLAASSTGLQAMLFDGLTLGTRTAWAGFAAAGFFMLALTLQLLPPLPSFRRRVPQGDASAR